MIGAEIQANVIEALVSGRSLTSAPWWAATLLLVLIVGAGVAAGFRLGPVAGVTVNLLLMAVVPAVAYACFLSDVVLPVGAAHLGLTLGFVGTLGVRLTGEQRRRKDLVDLFGRYVSDDVVDMLVSSGRVPDLGGESVAVTVLFMDIRNFTTIAERLQPHDVVAMLNASFGRIVAPVLDRGGTVDKFMGDGMMAVFGSPVPYEDHARRAVLAALEIDRCAQEFVAWMSDNLDSESLPDFAIGVGLHTGPAVTGNLGSPRRMQFTAIGDTVNTASRIEGLTKTLGVRVAISAETAAAAGGGLRLGRCDEMHVKGRSAAVTVHELLGVDE